MQIELRADGNPTALLPSVEHVVREFGPDLAPLQPMTQHAQSRSIVFARTSICTTAMFFSGLLFVILVATGLYGTLAYRVTRRTSEIGVRMALGAVAGDVLRLVIGQGMWTTLVGMAIGIGGSLALTRTMQSLLFGVSATDPTTLLAVVVLLTAVSCLACWIPARRATKVDPLEALRYE
jgi:putative ABC transport system permease protein